jgi:hypothetical protein
MTRILMIVYGITAEQAAARAPAAQFVLTAVVAAVFVWLDSKAENRRYPADDDR